MPVPGLGLRMPMSLARVSVFPGKVGLCLHWGNAGLAYEVAEAGGQEAAGLSETRPCPLSSNAGRREGWVGSQPKQ